MVGSIDRAAAIAWFVGGVAWLVKLTLILANGGSNTDEGIVAVAFFVGAAALVVAGALSAFALLRRRSIWLGVLGAPVGAAVTLIGISVIDTVLQGLVPASGWFDEEVGILGAAVLALLLGALLARRQTPRAVAV